jgi:hypothetical protein
MPCGSSRTAASRARPATCRSPIALTITTSPLQHQGQGALRLEGQGQGLALLADDGRSDAQRGRPEPMPVRQDKVHSQARQGRGFQTGEDAEQNEWHHEGQAPRGGNDEEELPDGPPPDGRFAQVKNFWGALTAECRFETEATVPQAGEKGQRVHRRAGGVALSWTRRHSPRRPGCDRPRHPLASGVRSCTPAPNRAVSHRAVGRRTAGRTFGQDPLD